MNYITKLILTILFLGMLLFPSYYKSRSTAFDLVGDTIQFLPLSETRIKFVGSEGFSIMWMFKFSFPNSYDEDIYVYTSMTGGLKSTVPKGLDDLLRCFENLNYHPYSKEGIERARQRSKEGKSAEVLCK